MPVLDTEFSEQEMQMLEEYAAVQGVSLEKAIKQLCHENLASRLRCVRRRGEVRSFRSPKSD